MSTRPDDDPVSRSVAAYSADPIGYESTYASHRLDRPEQFAALLPPSARILDLGCGPGRDVRLFAAAGHRPIGLDLNPTFVDMARRHGEVVEGDIRDVTSFFAPSSFDAVWTQASLVHLSASDSEHVLQGVQSLLVPGGHLYACVPSTGEAGWRDEPDGRRWYTVWPGRSFVDAVVGAGFDVIDVVEATFIEVLARRPPSAAHAPTR